MTCTPLSRSARARLEALRETADGFLVAQRDLELRGPGEVLGTRQTGSVTLKVADLARDRAMVPQIERTASELLADAPERVERLIRRWVGDAVRYGGV